MMLHSERYVVELRNSYRVAAKIKMLQKGRWMSEDFVCPDRTVEQRKAQKGILEQLRQMRTENLGARYRINKSGKTEQHGRIQYHNPNLDFINILYIYVQYILNVSYSTGSHNLLPGPIPCGISVLFHNVVWCPLVFYRIMV